MQTDCRWLSFIIALECDFNYIGIINCTADVSERASERACSGCECVCDWLAFVYCLSCKSESERKLLPPLPWLIKAGAAVHLQCTAQLLGKMKNEQRAQHRASNIDWDYQELIVKEFNLTIFNFTPGNLRSVMKFLGLGKLDDWLIF